MRLFGWSVSATVALAACSVIQRGQRALTPLLQPALAAVRPLEHPAVEAAARRLIEARRQVRRLQQGREPLRRLLLSPLDAPRTAWQASSVTWAVLRNAGGLVPAAWPDIPRSPESLQAWLRQELAMARRPPTELWLVQTRFGPPVEAELVIVRADDIWRSGGEALDIPAEQQTGWVLSGGAAPALADSGPLEMLGWGDLPDHLREHDGDVFLESRAQLFQLRLNSHQLEIQPGHQWDEWDMTWVERHEARARSSPPTLALLAGDARLELRLSQPAAGGRQRWEWSMARGGGTAPLPLVDTRATEVASIVAAPRAWGLHDAWLVLERTRDERVRVALYPAPVRALQLAPPSGLAAPAAPDTHAVRQSVPEQPITVTPVRSPHGQHAAIEDPWVAWRLVQCGVQLARPVGPDGARPEPGVRWTSVDGGRRWELRLPQPGARGTLPPVRAADWVRALRAATDAQLATDGAQPQDDWLLGPLLGAQIDPTHDGVRWVFGQPVPDLPERLAHPRLALQDTQLARRFASHRVARPGRLDVLAPRHAGLLPLQLLSTTDPVQARMRFVLGQTALLRPCELALDDPLAQAATAAATSSAAANGGAAPDTAAWVCVREAATCVALVVDAAAPLPARRALAARLRAFTPRDLLAVEDSALTPTTPAGNAALPALPVGSEGGPTTVGLRGARLVLAVDVLPEAQRAADRLAALLQPDGVLTRLVAVPRVPGSAPAPADASVASAGDIRARLTRVPLFAGDVLLRALELRARVLPGQPLPDDLRAAMQLVPQAQPAERQAAARRAEQVLLDDGLVIPLWNQPSLVLLDRRLVGASARRGASEDSCGLPLLLHEARWAVPPAAH